MPPPASQIPGKYLCFLVTRAMEKLHVDPVNLLLSLTRLRDFLGEREVKELLLPVYDPNRAVCTDSCNLFFSDPNLQVYLHKKYYFSIG